MKKRSTLIGLAALAAAGGAIAAWQLTGSGPGRVPPATAVAQRGDIVRSVGGVGKVVDVRAVSRAPAPVGAPTGAGAAASVSGAVFASAAGRVLELLAVPGQEVARGQVLARLDPANARVNLVTAQAALDQANAQLAADLSGVTPQSLYSAEASIATANKAWVAAKRNLVDTARAEAGTVASAAQQVDQAAAQLTLDRHALGPVPQSLVAAMTQLAAAEHQLSFDTKASGPSPQSAAAARAAVTAAESTLSAATASLVTIRAVNAQQAASAQHVLDTARQQLAADQAKLQRDLLTERSFCGTTTPTITASTSTECASAASTAVADQLAILKDEGAIQSAQDAIAQADANTRQSEHQAQAQVDSAIAALTAARDQRAALNAASAQTVAKDVQAVVAARQTLESARTQKAQSVAKDRQALALTVAKDRQVLALGRTSLTQARSKGTQSVSQARALVGAAAVALANARGALIALQQGAPAALIAQDEAKIAAARAQLGAAQTALAQTIVRAPSAGTVTAVLVTAGSPVDLLTPVAVIVDLRHLVVSLDLSEFDVALVHDGLSAIVSVDALNGRRFPGRVLFVGISGVDTGGVVSFPVRIALGRVAGIKLGMNVSARIIVAERRNAVIVPLEAIVRDGSSGSSVTVVGATGRLTPRRVALGLADNHKVEVMLGLRPGERVVLAGGSGG